MAEARVHVHGGVVIMKQAGDPQFEEANRAIAAAVEAARRANTNRILFDLRRVNLANYYSYAVRHAEIGPQLGLDTNLAIALVGERDQADVLSFIERVGQNRGMNVRRFFGMREALQWLAVSR